ncbi:MAG: polysaccharide deacetylase family protein [Bacteroidales bacterium]|nr:polysaccharide deacetylase family protein [Bacteroidales bacterium]MDD4217139.1 polysaccharide deacetylase family protein [Bacteroidales bacterium]
MLLIYVPRLNARTHYAIEVCFSHVFKIDFKITTDLDEFEKSNLPCLWYAPEKVSDKPGIISDAMMWDKKLIIDSPGRTIIENTNVLFPTQSVLLPNFDLFAACFWHVTRMEEYNHFAISADTRFSSEKSIARKTGILQKPIVHVWTEMFLEVLKQLYPDLKYTKPAYKYVPTVDVDSAFMYKYQGFFINRIGFVKDVFRKDFKAVKKRFRVIMGKDADPWFCFDKIAELHEKYDLKPKYFFLVAKHSKLDRNVSPSRIRMKKLIAELVKKHTVGIHYSYRGNSKPKLWNKELRVLSKLTGQEIFSSRQHYLFVRFPSTYEQLINLGMKRDYSMVYPDMPGFRMGVTVPVPFFNLTTNKKTDFWLYPTMIMDNSFTKYQTMTHDEAIEISSGIINYTKQYGGTLITLWHNESLSEYGKWEGWNTVYESILKMATEE